MVRAQQRQTFLASHGYDPAFCAPLAGDASPRQYYRWQKDGKTVVLMDTPATEKPEQFCRLSQLLIDKNLSAPAILISDFAQGFILLEDFGDHTYTRALTADNTTHLYTVAVETLIHLHQSQRVQPDFIPAYTVAELLREALLFLEWYHPATHSVPLSSKAHQAYESLLSDAFSLALTQQPWGLILRDYHVDNLIYLETRSGIQRCGLLDFQCALWGPVGYDLVSLLEDARRDVDPLLKDQLWQLYGAAFPELNLLTLRQSSAVLSLGRHLKILGIFMRLAIRDGKKDYLIHLPRLRRLLTLSLQEAAIPALTAWFEEHLKA